MPFYEYRCPDGHVATLRRGYDVKSISCGCGSTATRAFANAPFIHGATTPKFQPDPERFIDRAQEIDYAYSKADQEVGAKVKRPRDYKAGIVRARALALERGDSKLAAVANELDKRAVG